MHRFSVLVMFMTLLLLVAGALVTSNDAGGAIPDWPLSWGRLVPPLEGGVVYAYGHRVLAATVLVLTLILGLKRVSWLPFAFVLAQALVGGMAVRMFMPKATVLIHACLAQLAFGAIVYIAFRRGRAISIPFPQLAAATALFAQTVLGAAVRHELIGVVPHITGAFVATLIVLWAVVPKLLDHMREAGALLGLTAVQIFLGLGAYLSQSLAAPQPMPMMVWFTASHVAVGSMAFGAAIILAISVSRRPLNVSGGMAVA